MNLDPPLSRKSLSPLVQELLHAIGQPLTSLQLCVLLRDRPSLDRVGSITLMRDMADQVTLLSRLFATLRQLLDAEADPLRITQDDLNLLLPKILPQWRQSALQRDITVMPTGLRAVDPPRPFPAHRGSIEACLQEIYAAALESTPDRGSIAVILTTHPGGVCRLRIAGGTLLPPASFLGRFALPAAKTLLDSDTQEFTYRLNPFEANLVLRAPAFSIAEAAVIKQSPSASARPSPGAPSSPRQGHAGLPG